MSFGRTLLLAVIAGALGAYIWFVERPRMEAEDKPEALITFEANKVSRVRLSSLDHPALVLEKKDGDWRIVEPIQADGDDDAVGRLLDQLAKAEAVRRIPTKEAEPLGTYGLAADGTQARVSLSLEDGTALPEIVIGNTTPVGYEAFARVEGKDEIVLVPLIVHTGVRKTVFDLREKKIFDVVAADAIAAKVTGSTGTIELERKGDQWRITSPIDTPADAAQVRALVDSLNEMTAIAYYEPGELDAGKSGLESPRLTFEAEIGGKGLVGFTLGAKNDEGQSGYFLERTSDGQIAKVPDFVQQRFDKSVAQLRDKRLFDCDAADVGKIVYERADGAGFALISGEDGKWRMEPTPSRALQEPVVERIRNGLATLAGNEVVSENADTPEELAGFGLDAPPVQVELSTKDGKPCGRALAGVIGADSGNPAYYLKRADAAVVMTAPAYLYSRMDMKADDFLVAAPAPAAAVPPNDAPEPASDHPASSDPAGH